ncbi:MAG TPA: DNA-deoxyinosine glycosylase [Candidatus Treponema faecavium]|nr:DNA-deoxyinosine glycosylase [Candidatus Treponema faecavium]
MPFELVTHTLEPVYDEHSRMLILGTMPSPASRKAGFYYAHPQNRFWEVISAVFREPIPFSTETKRDLVLRHGIALWDVLASCRIDGADDASIRDPEANDFSALLASCPITRIFTTGEQAYKLYQKLCRKQTGIEAVKLPSTSPANRGRWPLKALIDAYAVLNNSDAHAGG